MTVADITKVLHKDVQYTILIDHLPSAQRFIEKITKSNTDWLDWSWVYSKCEDIEGIYDGIFGLMINPNYFDRNLFMNMVITGLEPDATGHLTLKVAYESLI